jgi:CheY-like chemotaxis protein
MSHVLLVDDYADALEVWKLLLEAAGYSVAVAKTGADALEAAAQRLPQVAVVDLKLPDLPGSEVARRLKDMPGEDSPALIALTGRPLTPADRKQLEAVFRTVLIKPCEPSLLLANIQDAISARRSAAELVR